MSATPGKIDTHHHVIPPGYISMLESNNIKESMGVSFPDWDAEKSLSFMKKHDIEMAVTSISSPGVYFKDEEFSKDLARLCNEYMFNLKNSYPKRFGGFASLPLPDVKGALTELKYALDELKLDGVCLLSNYQGKYLGDIDYDEIFVELNKRKSIVFIHPTDPGENFDSKLGIPNALIEAPFDTTRTVGNLIFTGTIERYPDIRYILSHGGGTIPYLAWRLALIEYGHENKKPPILKSLYDFIIKGGPESGLKILKDMYYDTALTSSPYALKALQEFAGPGRIVFGSDFPFAKVSSLVTNNLRKYNDFSAEEFKLIDYKNCNELFPQLFDNEPEQA